MPDQAPTFNQAKSQMKQTLFKQPKTPADWSRLIKAADAVKASAGIRN